MVQVVALTVFAVLLARVVRAPPGTWRYIVAAAVVVLLASQLLPPGNPFREDVRGSLDTLFWLGVALVPVAAYALVIRRIRRRTGANLREEPQRTERPEGLVLIAADAALARDTAAAIAAERGAVETFSVGWRDRTGDLAGHARLRLHHGLADVETLWVAPGARGRGIGTRLLAQAGTEARLRGARELVATVASPREAGFLARHGFRPYGSLAFGGEDPLMHLHKALT